MRVKVTNVPVTTFTEVEVEVENTSHKAILAAVRKLTGEQLAANIDTGPDEVAIDTHLIDGWEFLTERV